MADKAFTACFRKIRWDSEELAKAHLAQLIVRGAPDAHRLTLYPCDGLDGCGGYHVGHMRKEKFEDNGLIFR